MDSDEIWRHIDQERAGLAKLLAGLSTEQWSTRTMCGEWTVREVAAHITQSQWAPVRFALPALRSGLRFNAMMDRLARGDRRTPDQLVAAMRAMPGCRRRPPGTTELDPLVDMLVHGQDIAVPLGIKRAMPVDAAAAVAERLWHMRFPFNPRRRFAGIRLVATDVENFTLGDGRPVEAPIREIVMAFASRPSAIVVDVSPG